MTDARSGMSKREMTPEPVADRRLREALDEHELERVAYLETLDARQRSGPWSLDPGFIGQP